MSATILYLLLCYPPHPLGGSFFFFQNQAPRTLRVLSEIFHSSCGQTAKRMTNQRRRRLYNPPVGQYCSQSANWRSFFHLQTGMTRACHSTLSAAQPCQAHTPSQLQGIAPTARVHCMKRGTSSWWPPAPPGAHLQQWLGTAPPGRQPCHGRALGRCSIRSPVDPCL